jgi:hypothetical protein
MEKVPDSKTLVRLGQAVGPEVIAELHAWVVAPGAGPKASCKGENCAWTLRWWRPTFTIRRTAAHLGMVGAL